MSEVTYYDPNEVTRLEPGPYTWKACDKDYVESLKIKPSTSDLILIHGRLDQTFKADGGKINPDLLFAGMPDALKAVAAVLSYGAQKYEAHSWKRVDMARYEAALGRHMLDRKAGELFDKESGLLHLAHEACNILFLLQDYIDKNSEVNDQFLKFNPPPTGHKET